jgi:tRNA dimethylallyltransferase
MTLYRGMDIGTAKPTPAEQARIRHHLLDVLDPSESASVAWWLERAAECVADIECRGKTALFVGGTPFYLKALLCGLFPSPPSDPIFRRELEARAESNGNKSLHVELNEVDPVSARCARTMFAAWSVLGVWRLTGRDWRMAATMVGRASTISARIVPRARFAAR